MLLARKYVSLRKTNTTCSLLYVESRQEEKVNDMSIKLGLFVGYKPVAVGRARGEGDRGDYD
jgi:hypothetical protein